MQFEFLHVKEVTEKFSEILHAKSIVNSVAMHKAPFPK